MTYVLLATKHTKKITPRQSLHGKNKSLKAGLKLTYEPASQVSGSDITHRQCFFVTVLRADTACRHLFHAAGKFCEKHAASVLVLDVLTGTFLSPKTALCTSIDMPSRPLRRRLERHRQFKGYCPDIHTDTQIHSHIHAGRIALCGPLNWSAKITSRSIQWHISNAARGPPPSKIQMLYVDC